MTPLALGEIAWPLPSALGAIASEITIACAVIVLLIAPFFTRQPRKSATGGIALAGVIVAFALTFLVRPAEGSYFNGHVLADAAAVFWKQILLLFVAGVILIWFASTRDALPSNDGPEFFTLLLSATLGMMLMGSTTHVLMLLLAMEIASMPSYVLAGFRKHERRSAEASLKFALFGAVCTAVMIYGMSFLYGTHGSLRIDVIAESIRGSQSVAATTVIGLIGVGVGLLFKVAAVPVHFWCPDAFEGAPIDVTAFLSAASKGAAIVVLARWLPMLADASSVLSTWMALVMAVVGVLTTTVGNLGALRQTSVKRLLAYSSISHAGYMLSALALVMPPFNLSAASAVGIYLSIYFVMNLGAFAFAAEVENGTKADAVSGFDGLGSRAPVAALAMAVCLVSLVGLPPAAGFFAKWKVLAVLSQAGGWWWIVVASVAINSVISLAYYARILRAMYFRAGSTAAFRTPVLGVACGVALVLMLVFFAPLERYASRLSPPRPAVQAAD